MRKFLLSTLIAVGLTFAGVSSFAAEEEAPPTGATAPEEMEVQEITGEVVSFDPNTSSLVIKDETGKTVPLVVGNQAFYTDLQVGDTVTVKAAQGVIALSVTEAAPPEEGMKEYVVEEGDTLSKIAKEQLGSEEEWKTIAKANNIENPDQIAVGQRLTIPSAEAPTTGATAPEEMEVQEITGEVVSFDPNTSSLVIKDETGKTVPLVVGNQAFYTDLQVGDTVTVKAAQGVIALSVTEAAPMMKASPKASPAPQK